MPAIHTEPRVGFVSAVGAANMRNTGIGGRVFLILFRFLVLKIVRTAEVVFRPGSANGWKPG